MVTDSLWQAAISAVSVGIKQFQVTFKFRHPDIANAERSVFKGE
jgi:hypothetical protein